MGQLNNFGLSKICLVGCGLLVTLTFDGCGGRGSPAIKANPQTIHFGAAPTLILLGTASVNATATSGLPVTFSSKSPTICSINSTTGIVTSLATGTCIIVANQDGNTDYAPAPQATQNIVTAFDPNQIISFGPIPALTLYGTSPVTASASSGLPVSYSTTTPAVCSVHASTGLVTDVSVGNCIIAANQAGNASYNAAPQVTQTLTVAAWAARSPSRVNRPGYTPQQATQPAQSWSASKAPLPVAAALSPATP